jgi:hypothetical protein
VHSFLCDTPKASKTKWSASEAYALDKFESQDFSPELNLTFSSIAIL